MMMRFLTRFCLGFTVFYAAFCAFTPQAMAADEADNIKPYIGSMQTVSARYEDTLLQIMRENDLGYVEIRAANPGVDVWIPGDGTKITLPTRHLLPDAPREGVVINLAEMRLYSFVDPQNPMTFPIGIGRDGLNTPLGETKITRKKEGPTWRPTPRMREEDPDLPAEVPPGDENPLGTHALYLGWPAYLIHGTHRPWGIGRRVSSGCIRMYPEHITKFFESTPVGTPVRVVNQPIKLAWINDVLYLEAHADDKLADDVERLGTVKEYDVPNSLFAQLRAKAGEHYDKLDWDHIRSLVKERRGYPIAIFDVHAEKRAENLERRKNIEEAEKEAVAAARPDSEGKAKAEEEGFFRRTESRRGFNN